MNSAGSCVLTLFSKQLSIAMPCQVICVLNECIFDGADMCVDTVSGAILNFDATPGDLFVL